MTSAATAPRGRIRERSALSAEQDRTAIRVMARARLRSELRSIVFDVLGVYESSELPAETAAWVEDAAEIAVAVVCDTSVHALLESIAAALAEAPPPVVARLAQAAMRHDAGID